MSQWDIKITAPNGATGHLAVNKDASDEHLANCIEGLMESLRKNDPEPVKATEGPAQLQPQRQAVSPRSKR